MRTAVPHVLIFVVLVCPYFCLGEAAGAPATASCASACTCADKNEQSDRETPEAPSDSESDCLCHGAITDGLQSAEHDYLVPVCDRWLIDDLGSSSNYHASASISFEPPHQFPPFSTGRDVCALTCALLL